MTEAAKQVAQQAEDRLDKVTEMVRKRFGDITRAHFADVVKSGRFADEGAAGNGEDRAGRNDGPGRNDGAGRNRVEIRPGRHGGPT